MIKQYVVDMNLIGLAGIISFVSCLIMLLVFIKMKNIKDKQIAACWVAIFACISLSIAIFMNYQ